MIRALLLTAGAGIVRGQRCRYRLISLSQLINRCLSQGLISLYGAWIHVTARQSKIAPVALIFVIPNPS